MLRAAAYSEPLSRTPLHSAATPGPNMEFESTPGFTMVIFTLASSASNAFSIRPAFPSCGRRASRA